MTLSEDVKSELCTLEDVRPCCREWELRGFLEALGQPRGRAVRVKTGLADVARWLYGLLRGQGARGVDVTRRAGGGFIVRGQLPGEWEAAATASRLPRVRCCRRAYVRGSFLARGFLSATTHGYHWEIKMPDEAGAERVKRAMDSLGLKGTRAGRWQNGWVAYLKDSGLIADWLGQVGAHGTLLAFENTRVAKEMRNKLTRQVNYETANLSRTVAAAMRQKEDIKLIAATIGLASLPPGVRALAEARLAQPLASLAELAASMVSPLSKSGANHRMRQITRLAERIRHDLARRGSAPPGWPGVAGSVARARRAAAGGRRDRRGSKARPGSRR